jgi:hypothetical protein
LGQPLKPCRKIGSLADDRLLLGGALPAGTSANEKLSLPQPAWMHTFFGREAVVSQDQCRGNPTIPARFSPTAPIASFRGAQRSGRFQMISLQKSVGSTLSAEAEI